jgi:hypothetical protein
MVIFCESYSPFYVCLTIRLFAHPVYATSHLSFVAFYSYLVSWLTMIWACAYYTDYLGTDERTDKGIPVYPPLCEWGYNYIYGGGTGFRSPNIKICFETLHRIKNFNWPFRKIKKKMYSYTTNWLNVEVNWNYTHRCSFRTSTLSNLELLWGDRKHMGPTPLDPHLKET